MAFDPTITIDTLIALASLLVGIVCLAVAIAALLVALESLRNR